MAVCVFEKLKTLLESDTTLMAKIKKVYIHKLDFFYTIPDALSPAIILNDGGEEFQDVDNTMAKLTKFKAKYKVHKVILNVIYKYALEEEILIGDATEIGLVDLSHLVENTINSDKKLSSTYIDMEYDGWEAFEITDPVDDKRIYSIGRRTNISYKKIEEK